MKLPLPYPTHALPNVARMATEEIIQNVQVPDAAAGMAVISAISTATQLNHDVRLPSGRIRPTACFMSVVMESGERKTALCDLVFSPFFDLDRKVEQQLKDDDKAYVTEHEIWLKTRGRLISQISDIESLNKSADGLRNSLTLHAGKEPHKSASQRLILQNASPRALQEALSGNDRFVMLLSDEADIVLSSSAMNRPGAINVAWDGPAVMHFDRANRESISAWNPRLGMFLMMQPSVWNEHRTRRGSRSRGTGHDARHFHAYPVSLQGNRFSSAGPSHRGRLSELHDRISAQISHYISRMKGAEVKPRAIVEIDDAARVMLSNFANSLEPMLKPGAPLCDFKDYVSKLPENVCRLAAAFQVIGEGNDTISQETLSKAIHVSGWHLNEFIRMFSADGPYSEKVRDAEILEGILFARYWGFGIWPLNSTLKSEVPTLTRSRFESALQYLVSQGRARKVSPTKGKNCIAPPILELPAY